ncbi:outer membrane protein assembly factor BamB family protein [Anaerophaga thermohalophila]|uniref:outer membrane protein assembly factor BamB family protein n=1 Tax=Anaerophaga thermohalophila TaxID=177400 RepID=UPI0002DA221A|nr:PQQ-binding-like beta-propeller repeat protein [Anaerophaga thermohalophila]
MRKLFFAFIVAIGFSACNSDSETLRIAQLTDIHVSPGSEAEKNLDLVVDDINALQPDFVVVTGDLTNTGSNAELLAAKKVLDKLTVPYYTIPGNHETNWSETAGLMFNELWENDRFVFSTEDYLFVGFNTGPYMKMGDGHVKQEDLKWLERVLNDDENNDKVLIAMAHYPLADGLDNWPDVVDILKKHDCKLDLCGHGHRLKLLNFEGIPGIMGRSLVTSQFDDPGFTLLELRNDSAFVFNKEPGESKGEPFFAFDLSSPDTLKAIPVSTRPDYSVNSKYPDVQVEFELKDTASIFTGPCLINDSLLVYGNSLGYIKGLRIADKKAIWEKRYEGALFSTPVTNGEVVAFGNVEGNIIGLDVSDGREVWSVNAGSPVLAEGAVENDVLYIGGGHSGFFKIDMSDGSVLWKYSDIDGLVQGKPALGKKEVVFGAWDRHLYSLDKETGALRWKWNNGTSVKLYSPGNIKPVISNGKVFIVAPDRYMTAIDLETGKQLWRTNEHQVRESMGISPDGTQVYAKLMNDSILAMSSLTANPKTLWTIDAGINYDHNPCPVVAGNKWVAGATKNGLVTIVSSDGRRVLWKYKAGNSSINKIVTDDEGNLWITLMEGMVMKLRHPMNIR